MIHLGDITKIDGKRIEPVDVIVGGSPCQDLSIAGKRAGLAGERSGLYMDQIRIIKEMRDADHQRGRPDELCRPRYMVWENVPGAFSSQKGADFAAVLEEVIRVIEPKAADAERSLSGASRTYNIGSYHSNAWKSDNPHSGVYETEVSKTLDALNCGYPACNQGGTAVVCMATQQGGAEVRADDRAGESAGAGGDGRLDAVSGGFCHESAKARSIGWGEELAPTLTAGPVPGVVSAVTLEPGIDAREGGTAIVAIHQNASGELKTSTKGYTIGTTSNASARNTPMIFDARGNGDGDTVSTITGDHENKVTDYTALLTMQGFGDYKENGVASACKSRDYKDATDLVVSGIDARNGAENGDLCGTLQAKPNGGFSCNCIHPVRINKSVRRLTPLECERLQGFPSEKKWDVSNQIIKEVGWTDIGEWVDSKGKRHDSSDSARYKALGNSIALPFWHWLFKRISAQYVGNPTLGSLFDGISGFCLSWARCNGAKNCRWSSEIEEFPMAVTRKHFGDEKTGEVGDIEKYL